MVRPVGLVLFICLIIVFIMPNTVQLFRKFDSALGIELQPHSNQGTLRRLNTFTASMLALLFTLTILMLSHVSPFLYFQF